MESLDWHTPMRVMTGQCPDISALSQFRWWEPVCHSTGGSKFSKSTPEALGRFVGPAEHHGDVLTCLTLTDDALQMIARSSARSALDPENPNLHASADAGESANGRIEPIAMSAQDIAAIGIDTCLGGNKDALLALAADDNPTLNSPCAPKFQRASASAASTAVKDEKSFPCSFLCQVNKSFAETEPEADGGHSASHGRQCGGCQDLEDPGLAI